MNDSVSGGGAGTETSSVRAQPGDTARVSSKQRASFADRADMWIRHIEVSDHARARAKERLGWAGTMREVRADVRINLVADRVSDVKPNWAHGGQDPVERTHVFYVWDAIGSRCWVIAERGSRLAVLTLLLDQDAYTEIAAGAYVRNGMRRT